MFENEKYVIIGGKKFKEKQFKFLLNRFKEAFSHSSLSVERAFEKLKEYDLLLEKGKDNEAFEFYQLLPNNEKRNIKNISKFIIVFEAQNYGILQDDFDGTEKQAIELYNSSFDYFDEYLLYYICFNKDGTFSEKETFHKLNNLIKILLERNSSYIRAYHMLADGLDAFDYAMSLDKIDISSIIEINNMVNRTDPDKVLGFKKTNNDIKCAPFTPVDKKIVPVEIQKLLREYEENFGLEILDPDEELISAEEKKNRIYKLLEKEALFHIRFERIHPFNDGNGRTGRIIMNYNLLKQHIAPVIITTFMSDSYRQCINNYDVDGLTDLLAYSSSQQLANWVSMVKAGLSIKNTDVSPDNGRLACIDSSKIDNKSKKNIKKFMR